jgi:hypothetical protein
VNTNKANIAQIQKYLKGELDAKAMHALERQAQDDPFLMEAIEGYETIGTDQQANFNDLKERFAKRQERAAKRTTPLWRTLSIAATLLITLGVGLLLLKPQHKETVFTKIILSPKADPNSTPALNKQAEPSRDNITADVKHITGTITDPTGHALARVKVRIKGTPLNTKTDSNGRFSLASSNTKGTLSIVAAGYDAKQINLADKNNIKVVLNESANQLASVSVTAYVEDDKPANKTHPAIGWKAFRNYLRQNAFVETGETGLVKLAFTVDTAGTINGIHIIRGKNDALNQKAISLVLNGPVWKGITTGETRLKIQFRKPKES